MSDELKGCKIAVLMANGFEEDEFTKPREALLEAGATIEVISPEEGEVKAWHYTEWGDSYQVDKKLSEANADDYDALMLPGGVLNPDTLRGNEQAVAFTRSFFEKGRPIAAICHGPQLLIETDALQGRELTSYQSIKTDLKNAGALWTDQEVVVDKGLVTSRCPDDIPKFIDKMIEEFAEGKHRGQKTV